MRIGAPGAPSEVGPSNDEYEYAFELELDPGAPKRTERGLARVRFRDMDVIRLGLHPLEENPDRGARLARAFVEPKLIEHFSRHDASLQAILRVTTEDVAELAGIDAQRVDMDPTRWLDLPPAGPAHPPGFR